MKTEGNISIKKINGKSYYYHQYYDNGKKITKLVSKSEAMNISFEAELSKNVNVDDFNNHVFKTHIFFSNALYCFTSTADNYKKRYIFDDLNAFLHSNSSKVGILYGLRRTGKTTLIKHLISSLNQEDFNKTVFIQLTSFNSMEDLNIDLAYLLKCGFKYVFIDEITLAKNFISSAALISDIYAGNMKIIMSGTDSLAFLISKHYELYDRSILFHTTFIPFKEFSYLTNINDIDTYIEYGGTLSLEGNNYNLSPFYDIKNVKEYFDSAISINIEHSLKYYPENRFIHLKDLFETNELRNLINRIIESRNHEFTLKILNDDFISHDLGSLKDLIRKSKNLNEEERLLLDKSDLSNVVNRLKETYDILNQSERINDVDNETIKELEEYLKLLDVYDYVETINFPTQVKYKQNVIIQPGLRYCLAKDFLNILLDDNNLAPINISFKDFIKNKLLSDVKGRMLEEIVLYHAKKSLINSEVYKVYFPIGEIDMLIVDKANKSCSIYEIKYSFEPNDEQIRFLIDEDKIKDIESSYYKVKERGVIYRGISQIVNGFKYINVDEFLNNFK